jgi:serine protease Do
MISHPSHASSARRSWVRGALLIAGAFILGGLVLPNIQIRWREPSSQAQSGTTLAVAPGEVRKLSEAETYARAAQAAYRAVVNIDTTQRVRVAPDFFDDDWIMGRPHFRNASSEGSGVIIDKSGYILTNEHVVGDAHETNKRILVTLTDGRKFNGTIVGADHMTDVALIKVDGGNLPVAQIGTAQGLVPGQMCVAIGNPLGFRFTVTHGVISATGRPISISDDTGTGRLYTALLQHDASINPGNSGGPLVDISGRVIGINTLVDNRAQGIGFAIPIDTALNVAEELKRFGKVKRPWLGLLVDTNNELYVARFGLPNVAGVVVRGVYRDGPAAGAGLQAGDILTKVDSQPVRSEEEFRTAEKRLRIGQSVHLEVQRPDERGNGIIRGTGLITVGEAP